LGCDRWCQLSTYLRIYPFKLCKCSCKLRQRVIFVICSFSCRPAARQLAVRTGSRDGCKRHLHGATFSYISHIERYQMACVDHCQRCVYRSERSFGEDGQGYQQRSQTTIRKREEIKRSARSKAFSAGGRPHCDSSHQTPRKENCSSISAVFRDARLGRKVLINQAYP
jgi:hypothetical protein